MSSNNSSSVPLLPSLLSAVLDEEQRKCGAPAFTSTQDTRPPNFDEPFNDAELAVYDNRYYNFYGESEAAPSNTLGAGPQLPVDTVTTAFDERPRERRLAPAPTSEPTPVPTPAPTVPEQRPREPVPRLRKEKKVSRRVIGKRVDQACQSCRQKCDGKKPQCNRCSSWNRECTYVQTERQIEVARKNATETANAVPDFGIVELPRPAGVTPVESHELTHPWQPPLPLPEASFQGLTATPGELNMAFEGFAAEDGMLSEYPSYSNLKFGGVTAGHNEDFNYGGLPGAAFRGLGTMPNGFPQSSQEPEWTFRGLESMQNERTNYPQEHDWAFEGPDIRQNERTNYPQEHDWASGEPNIGQPNFSNILQEPNWAPPGFDTQRNG